MTEASTQNVVGVLEGRDSKLKKEYVALGAHYDHVGASGTSGCRPVGNDSICNGADDDGSGTTALLTMAEAFSKGPRPKRSILFVWHTGEEKGLWGSEYFTRYPTVPLRQVVAVAGSARGCPLGRCPDSRASRWQARETVWYFRSASRRPDRSRPCRSYSTSR